jgi:tetratricopeptide (TPR) repeat protein
MSCDLLNLFVNRQLEIAAIQERVSADGVHIVILSGPGGIGKSHLLRHLDLLYAGDPTVLVAPIIDFDEIDNWVTRLIGKRLATDLGSEHFTSYFQAIRELDLMISSALFDAESIERQERVADDAFFAGYAELAAARRIILRLDTFEKVRGFDVGRELSEQMGPRLTNTVVVVAGRELDSLVAPLRSRYGEGQVACHTLAPFSAEEAGEFFGEVDLDGRLDPVLRRSIEFLSQGKPIRLGLAVEWLRRGVPLPEMTELSVDELQALPSQELADVRKRFEFELVTAVRALGNLRQQAILYMAHFDRGCDRDMLALLLERSNAETEAIIEELQGLFFVKPQPRLHDEIVALVNDYVWPYLDRHGSERARLTRKVLNEYYQPRIKKLDEELERSKLDAIAKKRVGLRLLETEQPAWEKWILETQQLHALLWLDLQEGFDDFSAKFEQAVRGNYLARCELLLDEISSPEWERGLRARQDLTVNLQLKRARFLARSATQERRKEAEDLCRGILRQRSLSRQNKLEARTTLGAVTADIAEKVQCYQKSIRLAKESGRDTLVDDMFLYLGWALRQAGAWQQAATSYQRAREAAEAQQPVDFWAAASAYNGLAYVYRLMGYAGRALESAHTALKLQERYGTERDLALCYRTLGQIWSDQRDTWKAKEHFERAAAIFERLDAGRDLAETLVSVANIHRQQHHPEQVTDCLDRAIAVFERLGDHRGLADAYDEYGCELRKRARERSRTGAAGADSAFDQAGSYLRRAIWEAEQGTDWYRLTDALVDIALLEFYRGLHEKNIQGIRAVVEENLNRAKELAWRHHFVIFQGRVEEMLGDLAKEMGQVDVAYLEHYAPACAVLAGRDSVRYQETLNRVIDDLWELNQPPLNLSPGEISTLSDRIIHFCETHPRKRHLRRLVQACRDVKRLKANGEAHEP